ncbi:uncharacterized protein [Rutidosis leptorrhynchoides]|uniref:uncharacterized protein n=1 Tax=Rutidosis leptorrhynchoides TaxID=125765 RepID=UPI003A991226
MASATSTHSMESTTTSCQELKRKSDDIGWDYAILVDPTNLQKVQCKLCGKVISAGINRLKQHIAGIKGNVQICTKATDTDKLKCQHAIDGQRCKKKAKQDNDEALRGEVRIHRNNLIDLDEMEDVLGHLKSARSFGPMNRFTTFDKGKSKQSDLENVLRKEQLSIIKDYIARWFYECAIPFHTVEKDSFKLMMEAVGQFGPTIETPTRYELGEPLLKKEINRTKGVLKQYEDEWKATGCSIMTDAWTDRKRRSIMNLCVNSKLGTVFLSSKESSNVAHTKEHIYDYIESCIVQVGPENVVQVVTDNAANNMGAAKMLKLRRPTIFWTSCAAHTINLMLEAIGALSVYKPTLEEARKITVFIYAHHKSLALMSLLDKKEQLRHMFTSENWDKLALSKTKKGKDIRALVLENQTWTGVIKCLKVFSPLVKLLRMVDADWKPSMGFIHAELKKAQQEIKDALNNDMTAYGPIMDITSTKMNGRLDTCLHLAAYVLNPFYFYNDINVQHDVIANDAVVELVETLFPDDIEMQKKIVMEEFPIYKGKLGKFDRPLAIKGCEVNDDKYDPANWWASFGVSTPHLRTIAIRILSLTTSSSGCERNWSTFEAIHTKKRNRLETEKLNNLVYVQFNANLIVKNKKRKQRGKEEDFESDEEEINEDEDYEYESDGVQIFDSYADFDDHEE